MSRKPGTIFELGAIGGNLVLDLEAANVERAYKHFIIGAKAGCESSLKELNKGSKAGFITKK